MFSRIVLSLLVLSILSCAYGETGDRYPHPLILDGTNLRGHQYEALIEAAEEWNEICATDFVVTRNSGYNPDAVPVFEVPEETKWSPYLEGWTVFNGGIPVMINFVPSAHPNMENLLTHELYHIVRRTINHTSSGVGLKFFSPNQTERHVHLSDCSNPVDSDP